MAKRKKESLIYLVSSLVIILAVMLLYVNTAPVLSATPSDGCMVCHLDADVIESMYDAPVAAGGGG